MNWRYVARLYHAREIYDQVIVMQNYMLEMINERRSMLMKEERYDLFNNLLDANDMDPAEGERGLTDSELIGMLQVHRHRLNEMLLKVSML